MIKKIRLMIKARIWLMRNRMKLMAFLIEISRKATGFKKRIRPTLKQRNQQ